MSDKVRETLRSIDGMLYVQETDSATNQEIRDKHISGVWCESLRCGKCYGPDKWIADAPPSTNPDTISSSLVVGEPTEEMYKAAFDAWMEWLSAGRGTGLKSVKVAVRAAFAVQQKGEGTG